MAGLTMDWKSLSSEMGYVGGCRAVRGSALSIGTLCGSALEMGDVLKFQSLSLISDVVDVVSRLALMVRKSVF